MPTTQNQITAVRTALAKAQRLLALHEAVSAYLASDPAVATYAALADHLNSIGIRTPTNKAFTRSLAQQWVGGLGLEIPEQRGGRPRKAMQGDAAQKPEVHS